MVLKYCILISIAILGLMLGYFFEDGDPTDISGIEMAATFAGLLMFVGGLLGCTALLGRTIRQNVTKEERAWWELTRADGKASFIKKLTIPTTLFGGILVSVLILESSYGSSSYVVSLLKSAVIWIVLALASYAVADHLWKVGSSPRTTNEANEPPRLEPGKSADFGVPSVREQIRNPVPKKEPR